MDSQLLEVLNKVKSGDLSVTEGLLRLDALESESQSAPAQAKLPPSSSQQAPFPDTPPDLDIGWWANAWLVPFGVGTFILVLSAMLMAWAYPNNHFFWFYCSWAPLLLGLFVLIAGAWSRQARWAHIRIQDHDDKHIAISVPLPMHIAGWFLRVFGPHIEALQKNHLHEMWMVLDALEKSRDPISVDVDDKDGSKVKVYIV